MYYIGQMIGSLVFGYLGDRQAFVEHGKSITHLELDARRSSSLPF
jgi:hypothetical protein